MGPTTSKTTITERAVGAPPRGSIDLRRKRGVAPRIVMSNQSSYRVSYWVVQEDKKRTRAHRRHSFNSMGLQFTAGLNGGGASAGVTRSTDVAVDTEETKEYLMIDHRLGPMGCNPDTEVAFPAGCRELRVLAFFENDDGMWQRCKDKVYSISKRTGGGVSLAAFDSNIEPYRSAGPSPRSTSSLCHLTMNGSTASSYPRYHSPTFSAVTVDTAVSTPTNTSGESYVDRSVARHNSTSSVRTLASPREAAQDAPGTE